MALFGLTFLATGGLGLLLAIFLVPRIMRWSLGALGEAARANPKEKVQFAITDIYILIGEIAFYTLVIGVAPKSDADRVQSMMVAIAFHVVCWALAIRLLARTHIRQMFPRVVMMLLYPWIIGVALFYGISTLPMLVVLFVSPPALLIFIAVFAGLLAIFRKVSAWALTKSERPATIAPIQPYRPAELPTTAPHPAALSNAAIDDDLQLQMPTGTDGR